MMAFDTTPPEVVAEITKLSPEEAYRRLMAKYCITAGPVGVFVYKNGIEPNWTADELKIREAYFAHRIQKARADQYAAMQQAEDRIGMRPTPFASNVLPAFARAP